jgi:hypothetical protein
VAVKRRCSWSELGQAAWRRASMATTLWRAASSRDHCPGQSINIPHRYSGLSENSDAHTRIADDRALPDLESSR